MTFESLKIGKTYYRQMAERKNRKRGQAAPLNTYKMLVTAKNDATQEVEAVCLSNTRERKSPQWFPLNSWRSWTVENPDPVIY